MDVCGAPAVRGLDRRAHSVMTATDKVTGGVNECSIERPFRASQAVRPET